jgi:cysteinyl-tRNA synthetase
VSPEAVRYLLASVPYRKGLNFTFEGLKSAATAIDRLRNFSLRLNSAALADKTSERLEKLAADSRRVFGESLDDDLNTAEALAAVFEYIREANSALDQGEFGSGNVASARALLDDFDSFFDVLKPSEKTGGISSEEVEKLIAERTAAKRARDFARSDEIRAHLLDQGIILEDTREGIRWKRK